MRLLLSVLALVASVGCGSQFSAPISLGNPMAPSLSAPVVSTTPAPGLPDVSAPGFRNEGTEVWFVPPPAGDLIEAIKYPERWSRAQTRIDVFSLYMLQAYNHPGFKGGNPCGPNTYENLVKVDAFRWLSSRFKLSLEAGSVKSGTCTEVRIRQVVRDTNRAIDNIRDAGGRLSYITLDEPFASGTMQGDLFPGNPGCELSATQVAQLQRVFNDGIHAEHPEVQIGLTEPYPHFSPDRIESLILELDHAGVKLPYFRLDFDQERAVRERGDYQSDIKRIRDFCQAKGIPFGVIFWGADGRSNGGFATDYWATVRAASQSVGVTDQVILQSWAENPPGDIDSFKDRPSILSETDPLSFSGMLLATLEYLHIRPR